jgi:hypothetical protein
MKLSTRNGKAPKKSSLAAALFASKAVANRVADRGSDHMSSTFAHELKLF